MSPSLQTWYPLWGSVFASDKDQPASTQAKMEHIQQQMDAMPTAQSKMMTTTQVSYGAESTKPYQDMGTEHHRTSSLKTMDDDDIMDLEALEEGHIKRSNATSIGHLEKGRTA
jgi:hypothetical protein